MAREYAGGRRRAEIFHVRGAIGGLGVAAVHGPTHKLSDRALLSFPAYDRLLQQGGLTALMELGLSGRRALVTAASRGLGRACASTLIAEGARVFISSRDPSSAAAEIGAVGSLAADISLEGEPERVVAVAKTSHPELRVGR